jgi:hypothetical protein
MWLVRLGGAYRPYEQDTQSKIEQAYLAHEKDEGAASYVQVFVGETQYTIHFASRPHQAASADPTRKRSIARVFGATLADFPARFTDSALSSKSEFEWSLNRCPAQRAILEQNARRMSDTSAAAVASAYRKRQRCSDIVTPAGMGDLAPELLLIVAEHSSLKALAHLALTSGMMAERLRTTPALLHSAYESSWRAIMAASVSLDDDEFWQLVNRTCLPNVSFPPFLSCERWTTCFRSEGLPDRGHFAAHILGHPDYTSMCARNRNLDRDHLIIGLSIRWTPSELLETMRSWHALVRSPRNFPVLMNQDGTPVMTAAAQLLRRAEWTVPLLAQLCLLHLGPDTHLLQDLVWRTKEDHDLSDADFEELVQLVAADLPPAQAAWLHYTAKCTVFDVVDETYVFIADEQVFRSLATMALQRNFPLSLMSALIEAVVEGEGVYIEGCADSAPWDAPYSWDELTELNRFRHSAAFLEEWASLTMFTRAFTSSQTREVAAAFAAISDVAREALSRIAVSWTREALEAKNYEVALEISKAFEISKAAD